MEYQVYCLIQRIRKVDQMFKRACQQVIILNHRLEMLTVRYNRAGRQGRSGHRHALRLQMSTVEGVRNMYYNYAAVQCRAMDDLQVAFKSFTGEEYDIYGEEFV